MTSKSIGVALSTFVLVAFPVHGQSTDDRATVFVYYANETHLNPEARANYDVLGKWLRSDESAGMGSKIAEQLAADLRDFRAAVDAEVEQIVQGASGAKSLKAVVFTNALSSQGKARVVDAGLVREVEFAPSVGDNYIVASHPNSQASTLLAALRAVSLVFAPEDHRFSLVTKSHGSAFHILVPRLTVRHEASSREAFLDIANGRVKLDGMPPWMAGVGTTRQEYFEQLEIAGRKLGMEFDLVFTESCKSRIGLDPDLRLPQNISTLVSPREDLDYMTLDYRTAFATTAPIVAIGKQLFAKFPKDVALATANRSVFARSFLWWVPLLVLILIATGYKAFKKDAKAP